MKYALIIMVLLGGCVTSEKNDIKASINSDIERCREAGGLPILSIWDGRLSDCIVITHTKERK